MAQKSNVRDIIVTRLIAKINEEGRLPWQYPFRAASMNWFSNHEYTGINKILLGGGEYITPKQIEQVNEKRGTRFWFEKGTPSEIVVFYSKIEKKITADEAKAIMAKGGHATVFPKDGTWVKLIWLLKYTRVYNIKYIRNITNQDILNNPDLKNGIFEKTETTTWNNKTAYKLKLKNGKPILVEGVTEADYEQLESKFDTKAVVETHTPSEEIIKKYQAGTGVRLMHGGTGAYYTDFNDTVTLPDMNTFESTEAYCRVLFHEFIHSTGIESRLNRSCYKEYHDKKTERSKEELVAEVGGLLLASEAGFRSDTDLAERSENYVANWCKWMKDNPNLVVQGLYAAEKAKNYILSGGVVQDASSSRSLDNPNEKTDSDVDTDVDTQDESSSSTSTTKSDVASGTPTPTDTTDTKSGKSSDSPVKSVKSIRTIKGVREFFTTNLAPYFTTEDKEEKKQILDSVKADELKHIYKVLTKKPLPSAIRKKSDALKAIGDAMGTQNG